jgi:CubicO group peptidase (beta-lactamase class C family)
MMKNTNGKHIRNPTRRSIMKHTKSSKVISLLALVAILLAATNCVPASRVGELRTESQSVELGDAESVHVDINMGAGDLEVVGGADKLLEADFTYNVAELKPEVAYSAGTLVVRQPEVQGLPALTGITNYRYEWDLRLYDDVPMDLSVDMGAGKSDLKLAGLSLTRLDINVGAGESTVDLSGDWARDLDVSITGGAGRLTVRLPRDVGARVEVETGVGEIDAPGLAQDGDVYTNAAYGVSEVTLQVDVRAGVGQINLEVEETAAPEVEEAEEEAAATPDYSSVTGELSQLIQAAVEEAGITGLSVALVDDQEIVWSEGFGYADVENGVEATPETVYMVASVSKLFTAAAIMQLADQGEIDIDQPLQTYVPEFSINSRFPEAGPITPRSLLTHHSGLPSNWINGMFAFGDDRDALTRSEFSNLVQEIKGAYVTNPPNTAFSYSNLGYSLLGHAVEQVTGQEFSDYMDGAILGPMGMDSSSFTLRSDMKPRLSKEYLNGEEQDRIWTRDIPAATLRSTVEDLSRFMMMVFGDGELGGQRILRAETVAEMLSPQNSDVPLDFDARWGLGWWLVPLPGLDYAGKNAWHSGGEGMWNSLLVTLPDHKLGVVVLSNSAEAGNVNFQIATTILEQALKVKTGIERPPGEPPDVVSLSTDELLSYEGLYTTDLGWMTIRSDGTDLYADAMGQSFKLLPHGEGRFSIEGVPASDAQVAIKEVNGRTALNLYGFAVGGLGYGERLQPTSVPQAWMDRLGSYEITNGKPGFLTFLTDVQLKYENDFLMLDVTLSDTGDQLAFPIGPLSDDDAVILGLGQRNRGETISVVEVDGEEQLFYSGYLMKKLGTAELLQRALEAAVDSPETMFPGALLYVSSPELGTWTGAAGLGDIETNTPMRPDDKFRAGSIVKPFVAVVILQLVEEGLLSLDDPMTAVLPESITDKFADSDQITVRMLLNHTSGIAEWVTDAVYAEALTNPEKVWEVDEFLDFAAAKEPNFPPGKGWAYINTDYTLLGLVIEQATGRSWRAEIRERVIEPLDLENTLLPEPGDHSIPGNHAHGYFFYEGQVFDVSYVDPSMAGAAGGHALVTTAPDLARFLDAVLAGELFQNPGTLDEMLAYVDAAEGFEPWAVGYGLGLEVFEFPNGVKGLGHTGGTAGYIAYVVHLPAQDITIAGSWNFQEYFEMYLTLLEILIPEFEMPEPTPTPAGNVYQDPEGRFSITLVGDWTPVETDGPYALFEVPGLDLNMYVVTVESDDLETGQEAALRQIDIDPSALTKTDETKFGDWTITFYSLGEGQGVTPLCQVEAEVAYCLIFTGDEGLTQNPPEQVFATIQGFAIAGKESALPGTIEDFEAYVNSIVGDNPPGLSMLITLGDEVLYSKGFGMADGPKDMLAEPDSVYMWGSMTKIVTGVAIMQLVDQGLVDLDAPVSDYLDYFPTEYGITVRQLLDHSAGLGEPPQFIEANLRLDGQPLPDPDLVAKEYLEWFSESMFEPGSASRYSNPGFVMLGQVVAEASGQPYIDYVQEHILAPLGMENTDFTYSNQAMIAQAAASAFPAAQVEDVITLVDQAGGLVGGTDLIREVDDRFAWMNRFNVMAANGGLIGPATDAVRFARMHLNGGELDGVRLLPPEAVALMQDMQYSTTGDPLGYGLAWRVHDEAEHPFVEHDGGGVGLWAKMRLYPEEGLAIVLMSNASGWNRDRVADAAANVVFSMLGQ